MSKSKLPWPRQGDNPLALVMKPRGSYRTARDRWVVYADSYKHVADVTVRRHPRKGGHDELVMYPAAFMYRHCIELQLKNIIRLGHLLNSRADKVPPTHKLERLWHHARTALKEVWPGGDEATLDSAECSIRAFERLDPNSTVFRYAADNAGNEHLSGVAALDFRRLYRVMRRLGTFFESCVGAMDTYYNDAVSNYGSYA